jgi:type IX secretion system PorP/SprF family membrane protein
MKMNKIYKLLMLMLFLFGGKALEAQDIHYSQYDFAPLYLNPAQAGVFNGDARFVANLRDQWFSVPVPYLTFSSSFDAHFLQDRIGDNVFSVGGLFHYDRAGDLRLSLTHLLLNTAYHQKINKNWFVGVGFQFGYGQRRFRSDLATFDDQFQGDVFNPNYLSSDFLNIDRTRISYLDIGTGMNLRYQKSARTWLNAGMSFVHLNTPKQSFMGLDSIRLNMRYAISANASVQLNSKLDLVPSILLQQQYPYTEFLFGSLLRYHLNMNPGRETAIFMGTSYRLGDALVAIFGLNYQTWQLGFSYDINTSKFNAATNANGGFEISLIHIWRKVPDLPNVKTCPIF